MLYSFWNYLNNLYFKLTENHSLYKDLNKFIIFLFFASLLFQGFLSELLSSIAILLAVFITYLNYKIKL